jgi:hypothetical protein
LIVTFEDREWELDLNRYSYRQAMAIQLHTGMSISEYLDVLDVDVDDDGNLQDPGRRWLECIGVMYWLMHQQGGDVFPLESMDFDFTGFLTAVGDAQRRAAADRKAALEPAPDPTRPASQPAGPPSPEPASPTATTPQHHGRNHLEVPVTAS